MRRPLVAALALIVTIAAVPRDRAHPAPVPPTPGELAPTPSQEGPPSRFAQLPFRRWQEPRRPPRAPDDDGGDEKRRDEEARDGDRQAETDRSSEPPIRGFAVQIVAPTGETPVSGRVRISARVVADRPDAVRHVDFLVDGRLLFSDARPPWELVWNAGAPAAHRIEVRAHGPGAQRVRDVVYTRELAVAATPVAYRVRVDRVQLHVRLRADGELPALGAEHFRVLENGVDQDLVAVERTSDLPLAVGLLVDCSGSMIERLEPALTATAAFVDGLLTLPQDKAYTMAFADLSTMLQEFTNDPERLHASLEAVEPGRDTTLYDSVVEAAGRFEGIDGRRALVILTDGHDQGSDRRLRDAIAAAQRADVALYPVGVDLAPRYFLERWVLGKLARETGGRASFLYRRDDPGRIYREIADDLRSQYRLTYRPRVPLGDGGWREVEVRVVGLEEDVEVRARPGYYAD